MKLQDKFRRAFIYPLILGILILILLTIVILLIYAQKFTDKEVVERIEIIEKGKMQPLIHSASNLLYKKFQKTCNALMAIKDYYDNFAEAIITGDIQVNKDIIDYHLENAIRIFENYESYLGSISKNGNSTFLDRAMWGFNGTTVNYTSLEGESKYDLFMKQMMIISKLIPVYRSIYTTSMNNPGGRIEWFYFVSKTSGLVSGYPIYNDNVEFYSRFVKDNGFTNDVSCRDRDGNTPKYFYFQCRDWWYQIEDFNKKNPLDDIVISYPYKFVQNGNFGITVCIKFKDRLSGVNDDLSALCADIDLSDLFTIFDFFNNELSGYFYALRVDSDVPIYYPTMTNKKTFYKLQYLEFNMQQPYYIEELTHFTSAVVPTLYTDYASVVSNNTQGASYEGQFYKNGTAHSYFIFPVMLYTMNDIEPEHRLSIIYVKRQIIVEQNLNNFQGTVYPRLFIQVILITIMCAIIVLIAWYSVIRIAADIVNPIKNLKNLIQGYSMSEKTTTSLLGKKEEEGEDTHTLRSAEMDKLYDILLKLKHVLAFTTNSKLVYDKSALINYVNAKYTFNEVSNFKGKTVCDSNVGNLAIKFHKYDKAIFHLIDSLEDVRRQYTIPKFEVMLDEWRRSMSSKKTVTIMRKRTIIEEDEIKLLPNNVDVASVTGLHNGQALHGINVYLESRYPKLIYSFKRFFKLLRGVGSNFVEDFTRNDLYVYKDKQSLESFENILLDYITISMQVGDNRKIAEGILEYIEFLLTYRLKQNDVIGMKTQIVVTNKLDLVQQIGNFLKDFDLAFNQLEKVYNDMEYYKIFLDTLKNCGGGYEYIEVPHLILCQRSYYLKGKFAKMCGHLQKALEYFSRSMEMSIICDAKVIEKSIKQVIAIMEHTTLGIEEEISKENQRLEMRHDGGKPNAKMTLKKTNSNVRDHISRLTDYNKEIENYVAAMKENLNRFQYSAKDIVVLIDASESMRLDNKKIQRAVKVINTIYDSFISTEDGFALFIYDKCVNSIISLHQKDYSNYSYVKSMIENIAAEIYKISKDLKVSDYSRLFKAIEYCNKYLDKKAKSREKWIVVFTDRIYEYEHEVDFVTNLKDGKLNVIVVGCNVPQYEVNYISRILRGISNKSEYMDYEDISKFKNIFKCHGRVEDEYHYPNEKYESDKK
jgi:hypothetical protein